MRRIFFLFFLLAISYGTLHAQQYLFDAELITKGDGLAHHMSTSVFQDSRGFIWLSTSKGLNLYDGHKFTLYTKEQHGLAKNQHIEHIFEDSQGNLWLFYNGGHQKAHEELGIEAIDIFNPRTETVVPFDRYFEGTAPFRVDEVILPRISSSFAKNWMATIHGEVFCYDGTFRKVFQKKDALFKYLTVDNQGSIWLGGEDYIMEIDSLGNVREETPCPNKLQGIWTGGEDQVWIAMGAGNDIRLWKKGDHGQFVPFSFRKGAYVFPPLESLMLFIHLNKEGYWYVQIDEQLHLFNPAGEWICNFHHLLGLPLRIDYVKAFENDQHIWFSSNLGVIKLTSKKNLFTLIHQNEKGGSDCRGIVADHGRNIYFINNHLHKWNPSSQSLTLTSPLRYAGGVVFLDTILFIGDYDTYSFGGEVDLRTGQYRCYDAIDISQIVSFTYVKTAVAGRLLVGTSKGLYYIDLLQKQAFPYDGYNGFQLLAQREARFFHQNQSGTWLATEQGLFLLTEKEGIVRHFEVASGDLPFDDIRHIHEDADGTFWLATNGGGIIQWSPPHPDRKSASTRQLTMLDGLSHNSTYAIYADDYDRFWIPSDKGLMLMDKKSLQIRTFLPEDGLPHHEFNSTSHYQAKDGTLYFGGLGGLVSFHPSSFLEETFNHTPLAFIGYKVLNEGDEQLVDKTTSLQGASSITIPSHNKLFELQFNLLDYEGNERHRYAYKIEGYTDTWQNIDENVIRITSLPYGDYTLVIKGQNIVTGWSSSQLSLRIHVLAPFYLQGWFITLSLLVLIGSVVLGIRWRINRLKAEKQYLEAEVIKRTEQIERDKETILAQAEELRQLDKVKTRFFSNITHEFRTPLTLIIGPLEQVITNQPPPTILRRRILGVLKNTQHLLTLINQLLDLSKIESGQMKIEVTKGDLIGYTQELSSRFQPLIQEKNLEVKFLSNLANWETHFDQKKWDKIIYNLLGNAIKFSNEGGRIQLSLAKVIQKGHEAIRLDVKDTGVGIAENQLTEVFNRFHQADSTSTRRQGGAGIGLALVKELVELQGGAIVLHSVLGKGTSVEIHLPILQVTTSKPLEASSMISMIPDLTADTSVSGSAARAAENLTLLIIEDNSEMREYIRHCLDETMYQIHEAEDGEEGIEKAQALIPDLIISDVMMPKKNGFAVTEAIRTHVSTSHIPLILLTAKASLESRLKGLQRGADAYLTKPFSPHELAVRIEKLIEIRRQLQARYQNEKPSTSSGSYQQEDQFILNLKDYILQHLDHPNLNGEYIGQHFAMSRVHLYRKLKALTDYSISEFVKKIRLEKALALLQEGSLNISEISYDTGFSSVSHFSREFKKVYGKAPSKW